MAKGLTKRQEIFVAEYLKDLNAKRAAISAGYSEKSAESQASQLLKNPKVHAIVAKKTEKRVEKLEISADRVLSEIARMAFYDPASIASQPMSGPEDIAKLPEDVRRSIVGWGWDKQGNFVLKLAPKSTALDQLGRHLKLFTDRLEVKNDDLSSKSEEDLAYFVKHGKWPEDGE